MPHNKLQMIYSLSVKIMINCKEDNILVSKRHTKCSRQSSIAMMGGQLRLEIEGRSLYPAFATISGNISVLSV